MKIILKTGEVLYAKNTYIDLEKPLLLFYVYTDNSRTTTKKVWISVDEIAIIDNEFPEEQIKKNEYFTDEIEIINE